MPELGETDCIHYHGIKRITEKVCCGGKRRQRIKLKCDIHRHIYANDCSREQCGYYDKKER